jgi:hypothetical protein
MIVFGVLFFNISSCTQKNKIVEVNGATFEAPPSVMLQVYLKEFDVFFLPNSCKGKQSIELIGGLGRLDAEIEDCRGKMKISQFDTLGTLMVQGYYINSLDTLKKYSIGKSAIDGSRHIHVLEYFQPLADGVWRYYANGKEPIKKIYKEGVLFNSPVDNLGAAFETITISVSI